MVFIINLLNIQSKNLFLEKNFGANCFSLEEDSKFALSLKRLRTILQLYIIYSNYHLYFDIQIQIKF